MGRDPTAYGASPGAPCSDVRAAAPREEAQPLSTEPGKILLHYRFVEEIGRGAMGSVWRAVDTSLDRDVALKILPDALARDPALLARFEREARLLASLNHPNLAAVYGVHDAESTRFLAMELVPGEDLADRLRRGPLPIGEALDVACRISEAVAAAHENGVIHRDLKPGNVRVTPDGRVKVLDFGLAKALPDRVAAREGSDPPAELLETTAGVVLGTAPYMSPEQARGKPIDARSDIWSFGCVLWECLAGERPFRGETMPDVIASILGEEPDWTRLPRDTPRGVVRVLRRCLDKDPNERYHHVADARLDLQDAGEVREMAGTAKPGSRRPRVAAGVAVLLVAAAALLLPHLLRGTPAASATRYVLADYEFKKLTNWPGAEFDAAISPDGRFVVFVSDKDGPYNAYIGEIGTGTYHRLAPEIHGDATMAVRNVGFVEDGREVWLGGGLAGGPKGGMQSVSRFGGPVQDLLEKDAVNAAWSPDGKRVVYHWGNRGDPMFIAQGRGVDPRPVPIDTEHGYHQHFPIFSPDGAWIYMTRGWETTGEMDLWRLRPDGSGLARLTQGLPRVTYPTPLDTRTVLFVALDGDGAGPWLWSLDVEDGQPPRPATIGPSHYSSISASADGKRLVATVVDRQSSLWRVPIGEQEATEEDVEPYPIQSVRARAARIRGADTYYLSSPGSGDGLWRHRADDKEDRQLVNGRFTALLEPVAVSPDGRRIVFTKRDKKEIRLWIMDAESAVSRPLRTAVVPRGSADWSPDGTWIVVGGSIARQNALYRIHVEDGGEEELAKGEAIDPVWSPDGRFIAYAGEQTNAWLPLKVVRVDGKSPEPLEVPDIQLLVGGERIRFMPRGARLVYMQGDSPGKDFHVLDVDTGTSRRLTRIDTTAKMRSFDITADGAALVFDRMRENSDLVLIERRTP